MSNADKPKPCPFCGAAEITKFPLSSYNSLEGYACKDKNCAGYFAGGSLNQWNTRASAEQPDGEELEEHACAFATYVTGNPLVKHSYSNFIKASSDE